MTKKIKKIKYELNIEVPAEYTNLEGIAQRIRAGFNSEYVPKADNIEIGGLYLLEEGEIQEVIK
jgi:hypothetical protein